MGEEDQQRLFAEAMGKVQPIHPGKKIIASKAKPPKPAEIVSSKSPYPDIIAQPSKALSVQATEAPWVFVADGISKERLKRLAAGRPAIARSFDLHGMRRDEALAQLEQRFEQAILDGVRVICIIHGRGLHSEGRPVLKDAVYHWLRQGAFAHRVLAVIPQPGSGGGACLVLLRRQYLHAVSE